MIIIADIFFYLKIYIVYWHIYVASEKIDLDNLTYKAETETEMSREQTCGYGVWGEGRVGWVGRVTLTCIHYHV